MSHGFSNYSGGDDGVGAAMAQSMAMEAAKAAGNEVAHLRQEVAELRAMILTIADHLGVELVKGSSVENEWLPKK